MLESDNKIARNVAHADNARLFAGLRIVQLTCMLHANTDDIVITIEVGINIGTAVVRGVRGDHMMLKRHPHCTIEAYPSGVERS